MQRDRQSLASPVPWRYPRTPFTAASGRHWPLARWPRSKTCSFSGRPCRITPEARAWVVALACIKPKELGYSYEVWTERLLARHIQEEAVAQGHPSLLNLSPGTVSKILSAQRLHPHKVKYY